MILSKNDLMSCVHHFRATETVEDKAAIRNQIAADQADFLARGGVIERPVCEALRAVKPEYEGPKGTTRRWAVDTRRADPHGEGFTSWKKRA